MTDIPAKELRARAKALRDAAAAAPNANITRLLSEAAEIYEQLAANKKGS